VKSIVQLPGGFQVGESFVREVEFREMTGEEEEILTDARRAEGGKGKLQRGAVDRLTEVLARCTVRAGERLVEANRDVSTCSQKHFWEMWSGALAGDRGVAIVRLRQLSLGDEYVFKDVCQECKRELRRVSFNLENANIDPYFKWIEEDIRSQVAPDPMTGEVNEARVQEIADDKRIELLQQETHDIKLPASGKMVTYKLLRRIDEERVGDIPEKHADGMLSAFIAAHITAIDGEPLNSLKDARIKRMNLMDRDFLRDFFDKAEGGLDTIFEVHCDNPQCGHVFYRKLDVTKPSFFIRLGI
jgi:hypothetical protein